MLLRLTRGTVAHVNEEEEEEEEKYSSPGLKILHDYLFSFSFSFFFLKNFSLYIICNAGYMVDMFIYISIPLLHKIWILGPNGCLKF